jgi:TetR/AcrR family transcriptional regulator, regulator of autoinduction and epiphytic fitness
MSPSKPPAAIVKKTKEPRQLSPEKAAAILAGGMQEFLANGYAATSMDRVASAAGVSKATVYSHFQDKESLFIAIIEQLVEVKFQSIFSPEMEKLQPEPRIFLRKLADSILDTGEYEPEFLNFMRLIFGESGRFPELARAFVRNVEKTSLQVLKHYFTTCDRLKIADPEATARMFIGALVHFVIVQYLLHGKDIVPMERDRIIATLIDAIVIEIKPAAIE